MLAPMVDGARLHAETLTGDFDEALACNAELLATGQEAWAELIAREYALATGSSPPPRGTHAPDAPGAWALVLALVRQAVTGFDAQPLPAPPAHPVAGPLCEAWLALRSGSPAVGLQAASTAAREGGHAALAVECAAVSALQAVRDGDVRAAMKHARRASRMGRTESLPQPEYLAGLVLARVRRTAGYPHLSARILSSLQRTISPHWLPWLTWELVLAGSAPQGEAAEAVTAARQAASQRDERTVDLEVARARMALDGFDAIARDATAIGRLLRTDEDDPVDALPFAAFAGDAYVLCAPDAPGRRIRAAALPLYEHTLLEEEGLKQRRCATLASVLGLAGGVLDEAECFQKVYGFDYVPEMHRGSFDVLLHRSRAMLDGLAELHRESDAVTMQVRAPFAVPDPRSRESVEARLLRALGNGESSARAVAKATGLSVRQTQILLKSLAEEGECAVERRGRELHYHVEDTTFSEPTRVGPRA